jgi:division protein CdvB (Snf7/Vps24/ESCRT-III family)
MDKDQIKQNLKDMAALSQSPTPKAALDLINELEGALHKIAPTVTITLKQLKGLYACEDQLNLFEEVFGESVSFKTKSQAVKVAVKMANKFDFNWASENLLEGDYRKAYEEAIAPSWEAYEEAEAPLLEAYKEAEAPLLEAYDEAIAKEFAKCYFDQEEHKQQNHS